MLEPGSYVAMGERTGMIGSHPMRDDLIQVHFFVGTGVSARLRTEFVNWRQLTQVSSGTWDAIRRSK